MIKSLVIIMASLLLFSCSHEVEEIKYPDTGLLMEKYEYYLDDNGQKVKDGTNSKWDSKGVIQSIVNYKDGKKEGEGIYYKSENRIYVNHYKDDELDGEIILKDDKEAVLGRFNYKYGLKDGKFQYMHIDSDEKIYAEGEYLFNEQVGVWKYYDRKGKLLAQFEFKNGVPSDLIGKWKLDDDPNTYYIFKEDGTYTLWELYNQYSRVPSESMTGKYYLSRGLTIEMMMDMKWTEVNFDVLSFDKKELIMIIGGVNWKLTKVKS